VRLSKASMLGSPMGREDYPDCIFCTGRTSIISTAAAAEIIVYYCSGCGQSVEVDIGTNNERLL
jgi:transcription elongation factor Elf1